MINVLLIDDDEDEHLIFCEALEIMPETVNCEYASSAEASFELLVRVQFQIIFVDMNMPSMNGIACIEQLKYLLGKDLPLIVLYSTTIDEKLCADAKIAGAVSCLQKPDSIPSLVSELNPILTLISPTNYC